MRDEKRAEIKRVLLGRTILVEDGRLAAIPAGTFLRTPIGIGDGADAVLLLGMTRRIRHYASKDGKARIDETLCVGCGVCSQLCRPGALPGAKKED